MRDDALTRRGFLISSLGAGSSLLIACMPDGGADEDEAGTTGEPMLEDDPILAGVCIPEPPDPACTETTPDIEGPYYLPDSPERSNLDTVGDEGVPLALSGRVTEVGCAPLADVIVEIWHADPTGEYDNTATMNYRGWVRTDAEGRYAFTTLVPGRYLNGTELRPTHIHVKLWRGGLELLTTQIYFVDDPHLETDPWAEPSRTECIELDDDGSGVSAVFDMAVAI